MSGAAVPKVGELKLIGAILDARSFRLRGKEGYWATVEHAKSMSGRNFNLAHPPKMVLFEKITASIWSVILGMAGDRGNLKL